MRRYCSISLDPKGYQCKHTNRKRITMRTSLSVPNFCGKVIEATVSPQMGCEHNTKRIAQRFSHVYQSYRSFLPSKLSHPKLDKKIFEKVKKERLASPIDRFVLYKRTNQIQRMSKSSQKQQSPRFLHYRKRRRGFSEFFVIFETKTDQHKIEWLKRRDYPLYTLVQLHYMFANQFRPFSLTKRVNFCIFDDMTINRQCRTCCVSPWAPFWILLQKRVRDGAGTISQIP